MDIEEIKTKYQHRRDLEDEYSTISDQYPHDDPALFAREEAIEDELARGFDDVDIAILLTEIERLQPVEEAARTLDEYFHPLGIWKVKAETTLYIEGVDNTAIEKFTALHDALAGMPGDAQTVPPGSTKVARGCLADDDTQKSGDSAE